MSRLNTTPRLITLFYRWCLIMPFFQQVVFLEVLFCITIMPKGYSHDCNPDVQRTVKTLREYLYFWVSQMNNK